MNRRILFITAFVATVLLSCTESGIVPESPVKPELALQFSSVTKQAGSMFVSVTASGEWTLGIQCEEDPAWATLSTAQGSGSKKNVILTYTMNLSTDSRSLDVVLQAGDEQCIATLTQDGIESSGGGNNKVSTSTSKGWMELPATSDDDGLFFAYHEMISPSGSTMRNYSYYYDVTNLVSHWVAYPLNQSLRGSGGRTNAWGFDDPNFSSIELATLSRGYSGGGYDRGHQLPSADRVANDAANKQTFYSTNMTPQRSSFNQGLWANFESLVRSWGDKSDTLYVITGCVVDPNSLNGQYGEVGGYVQDNVGKKVAVPLAYYKAVLRYKKSEEKEGYGYGGYCGCAVYLDHNSNTSVTQASAISIDELEAKIGLDLFVNLPAAIGEEKAAKVEAQNPASVGIWW
ncbi:MAG: DNA/RNA non-specific endonuclease [Candidatus Cryptobacteroides sp.]